MRKLLLIIILLILLSQCLWAMGSAPLVFRKITVEVEYVREFGGVGSGSGQLFYPQDVAVVTSKGDSSVSEGDIFVVDRGNHRIQRFDSEGDYKSQFGGFGTLSGYFNRPSSIAIDFNHFIYVTDLENNRVQKFDIKGNHVLSFGEFGRENGNFNNPQGIAVDTWGRVFISDTGNDRIQKFYGDGSYIESFGAYGIGNGFFSMPCAVAVDNSRYIYIADKNNSRVQIFDEFGNPLRHYGTHAFDFKDPMGLDVDDEFIYITDTGNNKIYIIEKMSDYVSLFSFGSFGNGKYEFDKPMGIAVDKRRHIFIADSENHRVVEYKLKIHKEN